MTYWVLNLILSRIKPAGFKAGAENAGRQHSLTTFANHGIRSGLRETSLLWHPISGAFSPRYKRFHIFFSPSPKKIISQSAFKILLLFQIESFTWLLLNLIKSDQIGLCFPDVNVSPEPRWVLAFLTAGGLFLKARESS